jgi:flagellar biosynthesis/type III secretory pathway M-ring protein FliF/YscJ
MWVQHVLLDAPLSDLLVNPNAWFGSGGTFWITIFLGIVAIVLGYVMVLKLSPGGEEAEEVDSESPEEEEAEPAEVEVAKEEPESPDENDNEPSDE